MNRFINNLYNFITLKPKTTFDVLIYCTISETFLIMALAVVVT